MSYDASSIEVLEGLEPVRKRPAMYIGTTGPAGLHHLVYEVVDNSIDEALAGFCSEIRIQIHADNSITVTDNGRGIPTGTHPVEGRPACEVVMTTLHAGGKFDENSYKVSGGLHGVGVSGVNALASSLDLEISRDNKVWRQSYERGAPKASLEEAGETEQTGTKITFWPDAEIFSETEFSFDTLSQRLRELSFLNAGVRIIIQDERDDKGHDFCYEGGIISFVEHLNQKRSPLHEEPVFISDTRPLSERGSGEVSVEIALQYNDSYNESVFSFANNINTVEGGSHLVGFRTALTRTINRYIQAQGKSNGKGEKFSVTGDDLREGLTAVISVKLPQPEFEGQTKTKLGTGEVRGLVESILYKELSRILEENPKIARPIVGKVVDAAKGTPVLGAGGIVDGRGIAAALMLGAEGAWIGSAFLASEEANIHAHQKQAIVDATEEGTVISRSITGKPARIIRSAWTDFWERSEHNPLPMPFQSAVAGSVLASADADQRQDINPGFAGQGIGMIKSVRPAADIMAELVEGMEKTLVDSKKWLA